MNGFTLWHWVGLAQLFIFVIGANTLFYLYNRRIKRQYNKHLAMAHEALQAMTALKDQLMAEQKAPLSTEIATEKTESATVKMVPPIAYLESIQKEAELRLQELGVYSTEWDNTLESQQQSALLRYQFAELEKSIIAAGDDTFSAWESVEVQLTSIIESMKGSNDGNSMDVESSMNQQLMQDNTALTEELKEEKEKFKKASDYWRTKLKEVKNGYQGLLDYLNNQEMEDLKAQLNTLYNAYIETGYLLAQNSMELMTDEAPPLPKEKREKQPEVNQQATFLPGDKQHFSYGEVGVLNNIIQAQLKEIEELRIAFSTEQDTQEIQQTLEEKLKLLENQLRETESCIGMLEKKIKEDQDKNYVEKIRERKDRLKGEIRAKELMALMKREHQLMINQCLPNKNRKDLVLTADRIVNFIVELGSYFGITETKIDSSALLSRVVDQSMKETSAKKENVLNQPKEPAKPVLENTQLEMNKLKVVVNKQRTVINKLVERIQHLEKNEDKMQFIEEYEKNVQELDRILKENNTCIEMLEDELKNANQSVTTLEREVEELKKLLKENQEQREIEAENFEQEKEQLKNAKASQIQTLTETVNLEQSNTQNQAAAFNQFNTGKLAPQKEKNINFDSPYSNMGGDDENLQDALELDAMLKDIYEIDKNIDKNSNKT